MKGTYEALAALGLTLDTLPSEGDVDQLDGFCRQLSFVKDFSLTAAQMNTLNATPVAILPDPGDGWAYVVERILVSVAPGATPFELGTGTLDFRYTDASGGLVGQVPNATVESAAAAMYATALLASVAVASAAVVAYASADVTAGDGAVYGRVWYKIVRTSELQLV